MLALEESHAKVTPFVGVWIETENLAANVGGTKVTPFVGVWIETMQDRLDAVKFQSHTLRGCVD